MAASRKTFKVADLLDRVNYMLAASHADDVAKREAASALLESVLHDTGNYRGFCYIGGWPTADESRREYFRCYLLDA